MLDRYNITLGFYEPTFFYLHTIGDGKLREMKSWDASQKSTFLHEYIHFLQDITTIQGFNNLFINGEYFRYINHTIKQFASRKIHVPINPLDANKNVDQNWLVRICTMGESKPVESIKAYYPKHELDLVDYNDGKKVPLNVVKLKCNDKYGNFEEITFGTLHILEGMAKLIQEFVYPTEERTSPYNPYYIACDVAELIIPGIKKTPNTLIALFDFALQTTNPGWHFVSYLESKRHNGYDAQSLTPEIVYADLENYSMDISSLGELKFSDAYVAFQGGAEDVMNECLGGRWYWKNIEIWYKKILQRSRKLRYKHPRFFQSLAESGDIVSNEVFMNMLKAFGTPLTTNVNDYFDIIRPKNIFITKEELVNVYAMMNIHQVFLSNGTFTCPIRKFCQNKRCGFLKQTMDEHCMSHPWKHVNKWNPCYFNIWWKFKGFGDIEIVSGSLK